MRPQNDQPAYPISEAASYVRVAPATLRSWVNGRSYPKAGGTGHFRPLILPADRARGLLSFNNLVEAHVLRALRAKHGTSIRAIRTALEYAQRELGVERLLLSHELSTDAQDVFLGCYGALINLSRSGQLAMQSVLSAHLKRVDWEDSRLPVRLFPFVGPDAVADSRHIAIDPAVGFGRPIIFRRGISTHVIVDRIDAGETVQDIAADYELATSEVEEAVVYEQAA